MCKDARWRASSARNQRIDLLASEGLEREPTLTPALGGPVEPPVRDDVHAVVCDVLLTGRQLVQVEPLDELPVRTGLVENDEELPIGQLRGDPYEVLDTEITPAQLHGVPVVPAAVVCELVVPGPHLRRGETEMLLVVEHLGSQLRGRNHEFLLCF